MRTRLLKNWRNILKLIFSMFRSFLYLFNNIGRFSVLTLYGIYGNFSLKYVVFCIIIISVILNFCDVKLEWEVITLENRIDYVNKKVKNRLDFNYRRFFSMFGIWLICAAMSAVPILLRPMFSADGTQAVNYWSEMMSTNEPMYLLIILSALAITMTLIMGRGSSGVVYFVSFLQAAYLFLAIIGYLMLEGDPAVFGQNVVRINQIGFIVEFIMAIAIFITSNFGIKEVKVD